MYAQCRRSSSDRAVDFPCARVRRYSPEPDCCRDDARNRRRPFSRDLHFFWRDAFNSGKIPDRVIRWEYRDSALIKPVVNVKGSQMLRELVQSHTATKDDRRRARRKKRSAQKCKNECSCIPADILSRSIRLDGLRPILSICRRLLSGHDSLFRCAEKVQIDRTQ